MTIRIVSQVVVDTTLEGPLTFGTALDVKFEHACWTHTSLCAAALMQSLAQLAQGDQHKITIYYNDEETPRYEWFGYLGRTLSHPNTQDEFEQIWKQMEREA